MLLGELAGFGVTGKTGSGDHDRGLVGKNREQRNRTVARRLLPGMSRYFLALLGAFAVPMTAAQAGWVEDYESLLRKYVSEW